MLTRKRFVTVVLFLSLAGLAGCGSSAFTDLLITSVDITPANPTIAVGAKQQFMLSATFAGGVTNHESPTDTAWFSDNAAVATINHVGIATALTPGTAQIKGSYKGNNTTTTLTVTAAPADVMSAASGDSRALHVTNLRTGQQLFIAADGLRDVITITREGASAAVNANSSAVMTNADAEFSVQPEHGPAWLAVDPTGKYLYVVNHVSQSLSAFAIDWKTGALTAVPFSPVRLGAQPWSVTVAPDGSGLAVKHFQDPEVSHFRIDPITGALKPFGEN